jgi:vacuolar-type H+-ATPase subunit E/Vma4
MRQISKGMGANLDGQIRKERDRLLSVIKMSDEKAKSSALSEDGWRERYKIERQLEGIYSYVEKIW